MKVVISLRFQASTEAPDATHRMDLKILAWETTQVGSRQQLRVACALVELRSLRKSWKCGKSWNLELAIVVARREPQFEGKGYIRMQNPLDDREVESAFVQLCRALNRRRWWRCDGDRSSGPFGRMLDELVALKRQFRGINAANDESLLALIVALQARGTISPDLRFTRKSVSQFLDGKAGRLHHCFVHARPILKALVRGVEANSDQPSKVEQFLLPMDPGQLDEPHLTPLPEKRDEREAMSLFHPSFRFPAPASPQRLCEVEAEHERLQILSKRNVDCWLIRVAAGRRFFVVNTDGGSISPIGDATLRCLKAGVKCLFIFPQEGFDRVAAKSVEEFRAAIQRKEPQLTHELPLYELPLTSSNAPHIPGTWDRFFSQAQRTVLFRTQKLESEDTKESWMINNTLMLTLRSSVLLSTHDCDWQEFSEFMQWLREFVVPRIPKCNPTVAS